MAIEPRPKHPILDANGNITIAWDLWCTLISVNAGGEGVATLPLSHTNIAHITNVGANTHAQIDAHLANTSNPHSVTLAQVGGTLDHGSLNGLSDDDHTQYILVDGSRDFTGSQNAQNILPVTDSTYDLGSSSVFWRTIYTDDIIAKAPHADVRAFGATGDGSTDDLTAIEAARDAAGVGGTVYFPVGTYRVSAIVWCNVQDQTWLFDNGADIKPADSGHTDVAILRCDATTGVVIDNATINGNSANTGLATGIIMSTDGTVKNCT
ncbi:MAG: hypothetical protein KAS32_16520, partial [Candidatus Peribacteraceae bacterium]|nr:hypothetical protein [Candidatus Peribacteraceae bacterium]